MTDALALLKASPCDEFGMVNFIACTAMSSKSAAKRMARSLEKAPIAVVHSGDRAHLIALLERPMQLERAMLYARALSRLCMGEVVSVAPDCSAGAVWVAPKLTDIDAYRVRLAVARERDLAAVLDLTGIDAPSCIVETRLGSYTITTGA